MLSLEEEEEKVLLAPLATVSMITPTPSSAGCVTLSVGGFFEEEEEEGKIFDDTEFYDKQDQKLMQQEQLPLDDEDEEDVFFNKRRIGSKKRKSFYTHHTCLLTSFPFQLYFGFLFRYVFCRMENALLALIYFTFISIH